MSEEEEEIVDRIVKKRIQYAFGEFARLLRKKAEHAVCDDAKKALEQVAWIADSVKIK